MIIINSNFTKGGIEPQDVSDWFEYDPNFITDFVATKLGNLMFISFIKNPPSKTGTDHLTFSYENFDIMSNIISGIPSNFSYYMIKGNYNTSLATIYSIRSANGAIINVSDNNLEPEYHEFCFQIL